MKETIIRYAVSFIVPYLIGSISFSIIITYLISKKDIRGMGSSNAGGTNVMRNMGKTAGISVMVLDLLKSFAAVMLIKVWFSEKDVIFYCLAGLACVLGHMFPLYFKFKGGKGVACGAGMALAVDWRVFIVLISVFLLITLISRYVSLASVLAATSYPVSVFIFIVLNGNYKVNYPILTTILAVASAGLVIFMHRENIKNLIKGTERRLGRKKS